MRRGLFGKLAVQNIRNNRSTYIPYMLTCIFCIAMMYMMEFLRDCPTLEKAVPQAAEVRMIVGTGEVVVGIFCVIFLIYSNSFLMKHRQKEIGLYNILGLEKGHIGKVMFLETSMTSLLSLTAGIGIGILGSKLSLLLLFRFLHVPAVLGFYVSITGILFCIAGFGGIFLVILALNLTRVRMNNPTERFPDILFESCASGGARFDPGMLYFAPQTWTSDDTDAAEREKIQYGTSFVYPIVSMGLRTTR